MIPSLSRACLPATAQLNEYLLGFFPDPAWAAWIVAQVNVAFSVGCAAESIDLSNLGSSLSSAELARHLYRALADLALSGPLNLEQRDGATIIELAQRGAASLGAVTMNGYELFARSCGITNAQTLEALIPSAAQASRRLLKQYGMEDLRKQHAAQPALPSTRATGTSRLHTTDENTIARRSEATALAALVLPGVCAVHNGSRSECGVRVGCMRTRAVNYDPAARLPDDVTCIVRGCTSAEAANYDSEATVDDGSCVDARVGCNMLGALNYDPKATSLARGLDDSRACVFPKPRHQCRQPSASNYLAIGLCEFAGCIHSNALNYDPKATLDDGSCHSPVVGCTQSVAENFVPNATRDDGRCVVQGCTLPQASNYMAIATHDDGSCEHVPSGCTDTRALNFDGHARRHVADSCIFAGCTDSTSLSYDPIANLDNGLCVPRVIGCSDPRADNFMPGALDPEKLGSKAISAGMTAVPCVIRGCTHADAVNFNSAATVEDHSCMRRRAGCMRRDALNYLSDATEDDGSCYILGCMDSRSRAYNSAATASDGSCPPVVMGCTDAQGGADNFHLRAEHDDGSCIYVGCTDSSALNHNERASHSSGRCERVSDALAAQVRAAAVPQAEMLTSDGIAVNFSFGVSSQAGATDPQTNSASSASQAQMRSNEVISEADAFDTLMALGIEAERAHGLTGAGAVYLMRVLDSHAQGGKPQPGVIAVGTLLTKPAEVGDGRRFERTDIDNRVISLRAFDWFGCAVSRLSDLDGDGIAELAVGARGDDGSDGSSLNAGAVYVIFLDQVGQVRFYRKLGGHVNGGSFGASLASLSAPPGTHPDLVVGVPGEHAHQGAVHLLSFEHDGSLRSRIELAPSTWGAGGPSLRAGALFGASVAISARSASSTASPGKSDPDQRLSPETSNYDLSVGAPGVDGDAGVVYAFDMSRRVVRSYKALAPRDGRPGNRFGSVLAYGHSISRGVANSSVSTGKRLLVGSAAAIYAIQVASGSHERWDSISTSSRWPVKPLPVELARVAAPGVRPVAILGELSSSHSLPLMWLPPHSSAAPATPLASLGTASITSDPLTHSSQGGDANSQSHGLFAAATSRWSSTLWDRGIRRTVEYCLTAAMLCAIAVSGLIRCCRSRHSARPQKDSATFQNL